MYVSVTTIKLPREQMDRVTAAFRRSAPDLKQFSGFLGLELWTSEDTLQAVARWESREAMEAYTKSESFRAHHGGPAGQQGPGGQVAGYEAEVVI
jgi:heme-degrading monooxygenase HmoA